MSIQLGGEPMYLLVVQRRGTWLPKKRLTQVLAPLSPNMNPFAEAWVRRIKAECLDHFIVLGENHLRYLIREWLEHYHTERPHQGRGNSVLTGAGTPPDTKDTISLDEIICHERLGGLLKHYERKAA
jgi:hypothetical protein